MVLYIIRHIPTVHINFSGLVNKMADKTHYTVDGKGLCIIIANFVGKIVNTSHLKGYQVDIDALKDLFGNKLAFTVKTEVNCKPLKNLSLNQFKKCMKELQNFIMDEWIDMGYDRLFVFLLSHGRERGLYMCAEDTGGRKMEKDMAGNLVYMPVKEIINYFTHKSVPVLEGVPRCFFIQACRGTEFTQKRNEMTDTSLGCDKECQIEKDMFIAYATQKYTCCQVNDEDGSAFIATTVKAMRQSRKTKDLSEIMEEVRAEVRKQAQVKFFPCNTLKYEIKVAYKEKYYPFTLLGEVNGKIAACKLPLVVKKGSKTNFDYRYSGFKKHDQVTLDFERQYLSGWVSFKKTNSKKRKQKCCELDSLSCDQVMAFHDKNHFLMKGEVRSKEDRKLLAVGTITVRGNEVYAENTIVDIVGNEADNLDFEVYISKQPLRVNEIIGNAAKLKIDGKFYGCGEINYEGELHDKPGEGVCGIITDVFQAPVIASKLQKRLFIVPPKKITEKSKVIVNSLANCNFVCVSLFVGVHIYIKHIEGGFHQCLCPTQ